jgi:hypothetical protein
MLVGLVPDAIDQTLGAHSCCVRCRVGRDDAKLVSAPSLRRSRIP